MINPIVKTIELPDGRTITLETGKLAKQADGSVMLRMGNTMLLATDRKSTRLNSSHANESRMPSSA